MNVLMIREGRLPKAENGGLFISPGSGRHGLRRLESFEIIMLRSGSMGMAEESRSFLLKPSDVLVLLAGNEHRGLTDYDRKTSFYWVHFRLPKGRFRVAPRPRRQKGFIGVPQFSHPARPERLVDLFCQFLHAQGQGFALPMEADLLVAQMLVELAFYGKRTGEQGASERLMERVKKIVDTDYHRSDLCPGRVAQALDVNPDYLGRMFKLACGQTIGGYLNQRRLREARKLLQESELNVNQVALAVGFNDPGYFRRVFRRRFDIKPGDLRRLYFRTHVNIR
jgi:AraC-like DNA-binding protein